MCGRYNWGERTGYAVEKELGLDRSSFVMAAGDVTPGSSPTVLTADRGARSGSLEALTKSRNIVTSDTSSRQIIVTTMFWGITGADKKLIINARAESALQKHMFADSVLHRRCIMPAASFYEWDRDRNKVTFFRQDHSPIYLAGFYQLSENRESFAILTTAANESMIPIHDRMPLMIEKTDVRDWLYDPDAAKEILASPMPRLERTQEYEQLKLF